MPRPARVRIGPAPAPAPAPPVATETDGPLRYPPHPAVMDADEVAEALRMTRREVLEHPGLRACARGISRKHIVWYRDLLNVWLRGLPPLGMEQEAALVAGIPPYGTPGARPFTWGELSERLRAPVGTLRRAGVPRERAALHAWLIARWTELQEG